MTGRHAGPARIADQALIDQIRACTDEIRPLLMLAADFTGMDGEQIVDLLAERARHRNELLDRALALLELIGEMSE